MHFDLAQIPATDAYKLLVSTVVPRPIALATTSDGAGRINAAPFSFFNAVSSMPRSSCSGSARARRARTATRHGRGWYARTRDLFLMDRLDLESWEANKR
jgi:flavin reductase (DIM6/NTAB) family NADH-FMN oxidoreductase RutF